MLACAAIWPLRVDWYSARRHAFQDLCKRIHGYFGAHALPSRERACPPACASACVAAMALFVRKIPFVGMGGALVDSRCVARMCARVCCV